MIILKRSVVVGVASVALVTVLAGFNCRCLQESVEIQGAASAGNDTTRWVPSDAELANGNRGVGWVFGRMIGVAEAPGSPNYSPFNRATQWPPIQRSTTLPQQ